VHVGRFDVMHKALSVKARAGEAVFRSFSLTDACFADDLAEAPCNVSGVAVGSAQK